LLTHGRDGTLIRIEIPDLRPESVQRVTLATASRRYAVRPTTILPEQWPALAEAVQRSDLRAAAQKFGVSHEAIRQGLRAYGVATDLDSRLADRDRRVRELAMEGMPWAKIAVEVGLSSWRVRSLCADLSPRRGGRPRLPGR
jgi:hypothetical protein